MLEDGVMLCVVGCAAEQAHGFLDGAEAGAGGEQEMDAVVIFDNVLVPWERVFMYGEPNLCNQAFAQTNAVVHMGGQTTPHPRELLESIQHHP